MRLIIALLTISTLLACSSPKQSGLPTSETETTLAISWLEDWLSAWELISTEVLQLPKADPPAMLFYDQKYVYTTSQVSAPEGVPFSGPSFFGLELDWRMQEHRDTLIIPDGQHVPVQLMTFAAPSASPDSAPFFVMAAPDFWKTAGIDSEEVGLEKMLTGVFLHEFSHARQMQGLGEQVSLLEQTSTFRYDVSDDLIQEYFSGDSSFVSTFRNEAELFFKAANAGNTADRIELSKQALAMYDQRQEVIRSLNPTLVDLDDIFLTMEGTGQYLIVSWLTHPQCKGGSVDLKTAIKATRRQKTWWSQDQGLALALLYEQISERPTWTSFYSGDPSSLIELIKEEIEKTSEK
ncbi:MAG: hypothetical protein RIC30_00880 [Marinoscillum sp.]|uniref:hypothetical protein n=1 Tax=Marinoscillum sp. TaxID=2024838 RepID=UPI0032FF2A50